MLKLKSCVASIIVIVDVHDWQLQTEGSVTFGSSLQVSNGINTVSPEVCNILHRADGSSK